MARSTMVYGRTRASLREPGAARTVLLQMARDTERAARIKELKERLTASDPKWTWPYIAQEVGVGLRSANYWPVTGGIEKANAQRLAEIADAELGDITWEWLYYGDKGDTPNIMGALSQLGRIEEIVTSNTELLARIVSTNGQDIQGRIAKYQAEMANINAENQKLLREVRDRLVTEQMADAAEGLADRPAPAAEQPGASAQDDPGRDSEETG